MVVRFPHILESYRTVTLAPRLAFLRGCGVPDANIRKVRAPITPPPHPHPRGCGTWSGLVWFGEHGPGPCLVGRLLALGGCGAGPPSCAHRASGTHSHAKPKAGRHTQPAGHEVPASLPRCPLSCAGGGQVPHAPRAECRGHAGATRRFPPGKAHADGRHAGRPGVTPPPGALPRAPLALPPAPAPAAPADPGAAASCLQTPAQLHPACRPRGL